MSDNPPPTWWDCPQCHKHLGEVYRDSARVRHLRVFINDGISVDVIMTADVTCSCGHTRRWYPGQEALERLMGRAKERVAV